MLTRRRVFASLATISVATVACASSGVPSSSWFDEDRASSPSGAAESEGSAALGGAPAQHGPRVSVYADVYAMGGARHVRANFHLDDDAYVVVGHIDADGILRIEFPTTPQDNGFARGHASYSTSEFFAGFTNEYRARFTTDYSLLNNAARNDSYDGGLGYVFVIASWQPMRFDKFSSNGSWDSYEVSNADYRRDPRPAVYELASLLAGTNPDAYTVQFARVFNTQSNYAFGDAFSGDAFGARVCSGFGYGFGFGFGSTPFGFSAFNPLLMYGYGESFYYRGSLYNYSFAGDCYYRNSSYYRFAYNGGFGYPYGYGYGYGYSGQNPGGQTPPNTGTGRFIGIDQIRRSPASPQPTPMHVAPGGATDVGATTATHMTLAPETTSPQYRTRGLVAHEDPTGGEVLAPRSIGNDRRARDAGTSSGSTGPMVFRGSDNGSRSQGRDDGIVRRSPNPRTETPTATTPRVIESPRTESPRAAPQAHVDAPRAAPPPRVESPRTESPRMAPAPAPRAESPRSEPARSESAKPASSSSSGKPPGKN